MTTGIIVGLVIILALHVFYTIVLVRMGEADEKPEIDEEEEDQ